MANNLVIEVLMDLLQRAPIVASPGVKSTIPNLFSRIRHPLAEEKFIVPEGREFECEGEPTWTKFLKKS